MANYLSSTEKEDKEMLQAVGVERFSDLYQDIPFELRNKPLNIPNGKSLQEVSDEMQALADKNVNYACIMRGAGAYDHYIPSIVKYLSQRSEFLTAYTPYQAELSQGILQSIFEFQTMMCSLTGMDVCNASVYDGSSAAAEAAFMCIERSKRTVLVPDNVKPCTIEVIRTYLERRNITVKVLPTNNGLISIDELGKAITEDTACVYFESPNYFGLIEDCENVCGTIKQHGARAIMGCNPMSLAILRTPRDYGADIAVGDAQPFGMPISFGGPYLGYIAIANDKELIRRIPGRVVGETTDKDGKELMCLLSERESRIYEEKRRLVIFALTRRTVCLLRQCTLPLWVSRDSERLLPHVLRSLIMRQKNLQRVKLLLSIAANTSTNLLPFADPRQRKLLKSVKNSVFWRDFPSAKTKFCGA